MTSSAVISPCHVYRYRLEREVPASLLTHAGYDAARTLGVIMVNPSTADERTDDQTIRKVMGFSARLGFARVIVGNKFAFRATDIRGLRTAVEPIGPDNDHHLRELLIGADAILVAWGALSKLPPHLRERWRDVVALAGRLSVQLNALALAKDGHPCHPLTLGYACAMQPWSPPRARGER